MAPDCEVLALRSALDTLIADQPPPPEQRYASIRYRASVYRRRRGLAAMVALVAAAALVSVTAGRLGGLLPGGHKVPSWALGWPVHTDRAVTRAALDSAVLAWRHEAVGLQIGGRPATLAPPTDVVWYLAKRVPGNDVAVVFEASGSRGPRIVAGTAPAPGVLRKHPSWQMWTMYEAPAPSPRQTGFAVGLYLAPDHAATGSDASGGGAAADNAVLVLASPRVRQVTWSAPTTAGERVGTAPARGGLAVVGTGPLLGRVRLTSLATGQGNALSGPVYLGLPGSPLSQLPLALALPAPLTVPPAFTVLLRSQGQGMTGEGSSRIKVAVHGRRPAVLARCTGPGPLGVSLGGHGGWRVRIRCDGRQHQVTGSRTLPEFWEVDVTASELASYRVIYGYAR
jgi:hypothetical protein